MQSAENESSQSTHALDKSGCTSSLRDLRSKPLKERRKLLSRIAGDCISVSTHALLIDQVATDLPALAIRFVLSRTPLEQKYLAARFGLGLPRRMTAEALDISEGTAWAVERTLIVALLGLAQSLR